MAVVKVKKTASYFLSACLGGASLLALTGVSFAADSFPIDYSISSNGSTTRSVGTFSDPSFDFTSTTTSQGGSSSSNRVTGTISGNSYAFTSTGASSTTSVSGTVTGSTNTTLVANQTSSTTFSGQTFRSTSNITFTNPSSNIVTINGSTTSSGTTSSFSCTYNKSSGSISGTSGCSSVVDALKLYEQYATSKTKQSQAQAAVSAQVNRTATQMTVSMIERRISASLSPAFAAAFRPGSADDKKKQKLSDASGVRSTYEDGIAGISAGDSGYTKGLWATYSHGWVSNDWDAQKSNSELDTGIIGADIRINERFLAGLSLTYVRTNSNNTFEDGVSDANGFTVIPYAAMGLMDGKLVLDIMTGYGTGDTGGTRARSTNASRSYSYDSDRWMLSTNATLNNTWNNFVFSEKLGWMMSYDWTGAYTDSASTAFAQQVTRIGEISLGARAGYTGWERFEPYAGVTLAIDPLNDPDNVGSTGKRLDNKEVLGLIGLNWMPTERLTTGIEVTNSFFREKQNSTTIAINGRFAF